MQLALKDQKKITSTLQHVAQCILAFIYSETLIIDTSKERTPHYKGHFLVPV